jgi:hypothetical protein
METTLFSFLGLLIPVVAIGAALIFRTQLRNAIHGQIGAQRASRAAAMNYMMASGTPATARVISADTGGRLVIVGGQQVLQVGLEVQPPGGAPYRAYIQQPVGPVQAGALQPGATVQVRVDPANPANVMIDFSKPVQPPAAV